LHRWLGGRRYSKNCGGPSFRFWRCGPLFESCTYLSYDSLRELAKQPNLAHLKESALQDYEEGAEE
jgi:hypothetical protein